MIRRFSTKWRREDLWARFLRLVGLVLLPLPFQGAFLGLQPNLDLVLDMLGEFVHQLCILQVAKEVAGQLKALGVEHFEQCPLLTLRGGGRWAALLIVVVLVEILLGGFLCHLDKAFFGASAHCGYGVERDRH